jgi:hypothetical protein
LKVGGNRITITQRQNMANQSHFIEFLKDEVADTSELKDVFMDLLTNSESWIESANENEHLKVANAYKILTPIFEKMNKTQKKAMVTLLEHEYYSSISHFLEKIDEDEDIFIGFNKIDYPNIQIVDNVSREFDKVYFKKKNKEIKFSDILNEEIYTLVSGDSENFCRSEDYYELFKQLRSISKNDINFDIINNSNDSFVNIKLVNGDIFIDFKLELKTDLLDGNTLSTINSFVQKININDKKFAFVYPNGVQNTGQEFYIAFIGEVLISVLISKNFTSIDQYQ